MWRVSKAGSKSQFLHSEVGLSCVISTQELAAPGAWKAENSLDFRWYRKRHRNVGLRRFQLRTSQRQLSWRSLSTEHSSCTPQIQSKQLDLLKHWRLWSLPFGACHPPWPWQTQLQSCASNSELASTTYLVWGFDINSILLKRIVNNQRAPNARRHKMLPGVQKPD